MANINIDPFWNHIAAVLDNTVAIGEHEDTIYMLLDDYQSEQLLEKGCPQLYRVEDTDEARDNAFNLLLEMYYTSNEPKQITMCFTLVNDEGAFDIKRTVLPFLDEKIIPSFMTKGDDDVYRIDNNYLQHVAETYRVKNPTDVTADKEAFAEPNLFLIDAPDTDSQ